MPAPARPLAALAAILAGAALLRAGLADYGLWFDEIASTVFARQPLDRLWSGWMVRETNPPLYYTLLKGWIAVAGEDDRALRLMGVLLGTADIAFAAAAAWRFGSPRAAILAALLLAVSPAHVDFSLELRGYMLAHLAALAALLGLGAFVAEGRRGWLLLYAAGLLMALYSHTTMVMLAAVTGPTGLWLLRSRPAPLKRFLVANAVVLLGWAWWAWITCRQLADGSGTIGWIPRPDLLDAWQVIAIAYLPTYLAATEPMSTVLLAAWLLAVGWTVRPSRHPGVTLLAVTACAVPVLLLAASQLVPMMLPRTLFWASGPAVVLVAMALDRAGPLLRGVGTALLLAVSAVVLIRWVPERQEEDWRGALAAVAQADPHATLLVVGDAMALAADRYRGIAAPGVTLAVLPPVRGAPDGWAQGLYRGVDLAGGDVRRLLRSRPLFTLARGAHDPESVLRPIGAATGLPGATRGRQPFLARWQAAPGLR